MSRSRPTAVFPDASPLLDAAVARVNRPADRLTIHHGFADRAELIARQKGHAVMLSNENIVDDALLEHCPDLRAIVFLGTGASSYIDLHACERRGVRVRTIANYGDRSVAEHTIALMFAAYRDLAAQQERMRADGWAGHPIGELQGKTLGIIGTGAIGRETGAIARALGMSVIGWSRSGSADDIPLHDLDDLLVTADIVSLHLALTPETHDFLGERELGLLRPGALLINTARGALVDEAALLTALHERRIAAGLDVFAIEPLPADHPLRSAPNVTLSCHSGWQSPEAIARLIERALELVEEELARLG